MQEDVNDSHSSKRFRNVSKAKNILASKRMRCKICILQLLNKMSTVWHSTMYAISTFQTNGVSNERFRANEQISLWMCKLQLSDYIWVA